MSGQINNSVVPNHGTNLKMENETVQASMAPVLRTIVVPGVSLQPMKGTE